MRILWLGNAPWVGSGYGEQAALFVPRLAAQGHELAIFCNYGLQGTVTTWNGFPLYATDGAWGNYSLGTYAEHFEADLVIALCDSWVLHPSSWPAGLKVANWSPIDHYPIPPAVLGVLDQPAIQPVAMSRFGETLMRDAKLDPLYVPHGVDTQRFRPRPELRDEVRDQLGIPRDVFLIGMVGANKAAGSIHRKAFPQAIHAFSRFSRLHDDAWLYMHTQAKPGPATGGMPLDVICETAGCPIGRVRFPHDEAWQLGMNAQVVANLYQAFDVLLMPSMGEGFGVPLIEAQACGVPVIASDHSAMSELTGAGWLVSGDPFYDPAAQSYFINPFIDSIVGALEAAYAGARDATLRASAAAFAAQYDADLVADQFWAPALERLATQAAAPAAEVLV